MRFGMFLQPVHHPDEHPTLALERDLELVQHLDRLGYNEVWIGEHHSTGWENVAAPEIFIAAAAERTRNNQARNGHRATGAAPSAGHHRPNDHARPPDQGTLDVRSGSRGRAPIGSQSVWPHSRRSRQAPRRRYGRDPAPPRVRCEPITEKTDWYELNNATLQVGPYTQPHMPMAVASTNPRNLELMGRVGGSALVGPIRRPCPGDVHSHRTRSGRGRSNR